MSRKPDPGKPATYDHASVHYCPFSVEPGSPLVLTADPWSYLSAFFIQKHENSRGDNRTRLQRAIYYTDLAESYYRAAKLTEFRARSTLSYYGVLNLVKAFISFQGVDLEIKPEHHGLTIPTGESKQVQINGHSKSIINIFHRFASALGTPVSNKKTIKLQEIISHIPVIHEIAFKMEHLPGNQRSFLPVTISILYDEAEEWVFSEMSYDKKQDARVKTSKFLTGERRKYFRDSNEAGHCVVFRCKRRKRFTWDNFPRIYSNICREYSRFNLASILTRDGYRYYCDLGEPNYHHLCYSFIFLYYIGTISRYRPLETEELMKTDKRPVIAEALSALPTQMLYHLVSQTTNSICVVPYSDLN